MFAEKITTMATTTRDFHFSVIDLIINPAKRYSSYRPLKEDEVCNQGASNLGVIQPVFRLKLPNLSDSAVARQKTVERTLRDAEMTCYFAAIAVEFIERSLDEVACERKLRLFE